MSKNCLVDDCPKYAYLSGYCNAHYLRLQRTGSPTGSRRKTPEERFWSKVEKTDGCWNWTAYIMPQGYGRMNVNGKLVMVHRLAYEFAKGPVPEGMEVDHVCFHRACVNPDHLRLTTHKQNNEHMKGAQRGSASGVRGVYKTGHRWQVKVGHNGRSHYIGLYKTMAEAEAVAIATRNEWFTHNDLDRKAIA